MIDAFQPPDFVAIFYSVGQTQKTRMVDPSEEGESAFLSLTTQRSLLTEIVLVYGSSSVLLDQTESQSPKTHLE